MTTLRQEVERDLGVTVTHTSKVRAPSAWRKTAKYWFVLGVGFCLGSITGGILAVIVGVS
jgi:glycerol uptake facilitator-like aquaporin